LTGTGSTVDTDLIFGSYWGGTTTIGGPSATGDITLISNGIYEAINTINMQTPGNILIKSRTAGNTVGINSGIENKQLSTEFLSSLHAGNQLIIGDSNTGTITANAQTWTNNLQLISGSGSVNINSAQNMGAKTFFASTGNAGDISFGASGSITSTASGDAVVLASGRNFLNNFGNTAISTDPSGRWLVYSAHPDNTTEGGLTYNKLYNKTYAGNLPVSIGAGNYMLYSVVPVLTLASDALKT